VSTIRVLAAVLVREGRVLIARRPAHKRHGGLWEFPGGKVEPGESDDDAMARELREELGLRLVTLGPVRFVRADPGTPFEIVFLEVAADGEPVAHEHEALAWVLPEELAGYALAPSDAAFAEGYRRPG
jgi:mutator protein MutT